jgi:hypothetical protein
MEPRELEIRLRALRLTFRMCLAWSVGMILGCFYLHAKWGIAIYSLFLTNVVLAFGQYQFYLSRIRKGKR